MEAFQSAIYDIRRRHAWRLDPLATGADADLLDALQDLLPSKRQPLAGEFPLQVHCCDADADT